MMTLDEAIKHCEDKVSEIGNYAVKADMNQMLTLDEDEECRECAEEHKQLAAWLREYKKLRQGLSDITAEYWNRLHNDQPCYLPNYDVYKNFLELLKEKCEVVEEA